MLQSQATIFERASRVFEGWKDPATALGVLRLVPTNLNEEERKALLPLRTLYHQNLCFLDGGRNVLVYSHHRAFNECVPRNHYFLDLISGRSHHPFPDEYRPIEVFDETKMLLACKTTDSGPTVVLYDLRLGREVAAYVQPGWNLWGAHFLSDGRRVLVMHHLGLPYDEPCHSQIHLLTEGRDVPPLVLDAEGFYCNHIQGCPADPDLFAYDRWPTPKRPVDVVLHVMSLDGTVHEPLPQLATTVRPGSIWGGQRDHYLWLPDGKRIASYFSPINSKSGDHYDFGWWLSVTDWRSGADLSLEYPSERWGGNFQLSPDGRYIVSAGGRGFQKLYAIEIEALQRGWNEQVLCSYPESLEDGKNKGPFHMPWVLPDRSGAIFSAGWPGPADGVYMVELPANMRERQALPSPALNANRAGRPLNLIPYTGMGFSPQIDRMIAETPVKGIDRAQTQSMVRLCPETESYLYGLAFTPLSIRYRAGSRPLLEKIASRFTAADPAERLASAMNWVAAAVKHPHLVGSILPDRNISEEAILASGLGWCNEQSRVFISLCEVMEIPARLCFLFHANGRCGHTATEVYLEGKWAFHDVSFRLRVRLPDGSWAEARELAGTWKFLTDRMYRPVLAEHYARLLPFVEKSPGWRRADRPSVEAGSGLLSLIGISNYLIAGVEAMPAQVPDREGNISGVDLPP